MKRQRKQGGYVYKRNGWWILRYRITVNESGKQRSIQKAKQLAPIDANHRTKKSVEDLVATELAAVNRYRSDPEKVVSIGDFMSQVYLPFVAAEKRPSTAKGYHDMWLLHLARHCRETLMREVRTCHVQKWLRTIAEEDLTKSGGKLSKQSLKHLKSFVSGIFVHAKGQGFFDGVNPVDDTTVPKAPGGKEPCVYSLEEIGLMLQVLPEPAATIVAVAGFTGVRLAELQGLQWEHYRENSIFIARSIWNGHINEPKTRASKAPIPVIQQLAAMLRRHRESLGNPVSGVMFPASNGQPLRLNNVLNRSILPALRKAGIEWRGWHSFRRGLASNLNRLRVDDSVIQHILRHSNVATTQTHYIKTTSADAVAAMDALEQSCATSALGAAVFPNRLIN